MHRHFRLLRIIPALLLLCIASSRAQNTVFTYQGRLNLNGNPANGSYDLSFGLYATNSGGSLIGTALTNFAVPVSNGLFTTALQFDASFSGPSYWLDISVRTNGGGTFTELSPRQWVTPTPQAIFANSANNVLGQVSADQITGTPIAAVNFVGSLNGDVTGSQGATVLSAAGTAGTYARVTTDAKGRVTNGATILPVIAGGSGQTNAAAALAAFGGASLAGNNVFSGANTFNGNASFASPVNFAAGSSQNGAQSFPPFLIAQNVADPLPFLAYNTSFDPVQGCSPTASYVSNRIALMASIGMPNGFVIQLDDGWMSPNPRTQGQALQWNSSNFPNGIAPLAAYAHSFGFKFLIYTSSGTTTCCGYPASVGNEYPDMAEFASWGVDWVKVDGCGVAPNLVQTNAVIWDSAIQRVGYPVGLEMSISGDPGDPNNLTYGALINDTDYGGQPLIYNASTFATILVGLDNAMSSGGILGYRQQIGPGHFSDAMIVSESTNLTRACPTNLTRQAMAICALLASPVQFDGPPSPANMSYITNSDLLSILRDPLVIRCFVVSSNAGLEVVAKPLQNGSVAVGFVNRTGTANSPISVSWPAIGLASDAVCAVRDPWRGADLGFATNSYTATVPANDVSLLIFRPQSPSVATKGLVISGTTNLITFGATTTPPASTNPVAWISVNVIADTNQYRLPLMK